MENTTLKLWKCEGFASENIRALYIGKTPNGQDCIAFNIYGKSCIEVCSYEGIIETFLQNLKKYKNIITVLDHTKTKQNKSFDVFLYDDDFRSSLPKYSQMSYSIYFKFFNNQKNIEINKTLSDLRPQWIVYSLRRQGVLDCEKPKN